MPYSAAGRVAAGEWALYDKSRVNGKEVYLNCKTVAFGQTFPKPPIVLVTANHANPADMDWGHTHDASMTYMDEITTTSFQVR
jgi:hypothetical protein